MAQNHNHQEHHVTPSAVLFKTFIALLVLTVLTVAAAQMHLGWLATPIAFFIAITKAMLVMMYFMGLKYDTKLNRLTFGLGFFFLALLFVFCIIDIMTRHPVLNSL